jgi:hypothetical protein
MTYQSFEDFYREATIKHLVLFNHGRYLISPPFCTDTCKEYSTVMIYGGGIVWFDVDTTPATSKYNSMVSIGNSVFFAPYGIWDEFNTVLELNLNGSGKSINHIIDSTSKGQFYSMASDGVTAFAAPLGYDPVSFAIYIKDGKIHQVEVPGDGELKRHMGTVYHNGCYYSPPRGESYDYDKILKFDISTETLSLITVPNLIKARRKYTDFIVAGDKLFSLPFGREVELKQVLVYDTITEQIELVDLDLPDFPKKYNGGVLVDDTIIALPYGHKDDGNANYGLVLNIHTYEHTTFDIGQTFGGKYRFRCGIAYKNVAVFLPTGAPNADILIVDKTGSILLRKNLSDHVLGRPVIYEDLVHALAYNIHTRKHYMLTIDSKFEIRLAVLF